MKTIICEFCPESEAVRFRFWSAFQIAMLAMFLWLPTVVAETVTIPNGAETREDIGGIAEPFSRPGNMLSQQIYAANLFPEVSEGQMFQLDGISFRLSSQGSAGGASSATFNRVEVLLSTGTGPFSTSLAQNHGADLTVVFDQTLTLSGTIPSGVTPSPFDLDISFVTPFLYNSASGSLVVEIRKYGDERLTAPLGASEISGGTFYFDRGLGVQTFGNIGLETRLSYTVVPEPGAVAIFVLGATAIWITIRKRAV